MGVEREMNICLCINNVHVLLKIHEVKDEIRLANLVDILILLCWLFVLFLFVNRCKVGLCFFLGLSGGV